MREEPIPLWKYAKEEWRVKRLRMKRAASLRRYQKLHDQIVKAERELRKMARRVE
jgi:hypothetical protein